MYEHTKLSVENGLRASTPAIKLNVELKRKAYKVKLLRIRIVLGEQANYKQLVSARHIPLTFAQEKPHKKNHKALLRTAVF